MNDIVIRQSGRAGQAEINRILTDSWGEPRAATHDRLYDLTTLPTLVATREVTPHGPSTANDNIEPLRFYQRRGLRILAVYPDAVAQARMRKASIPTTGAYGIPIRDEIVLGRDL